MGMMACGKRPKKFIFATSNFVNKNAKFLQNLFFFLQTLFFFLQTLDSKNQFFLGRTDNT